MRSSTRCGATGTPAVAARSAVACSSRVPVAGHTHVRAALDPDERNGGGIQTPLRLLAHRRQRGGFVFRTLAGAKHRDRIVDDASERAVHILSGTIQGEGWQTRPGDMAGDRGRRWFVGCEQVVDQVVPAAENGRQAGRREAFQEHS